MLLLLTSMERRIKSIYIILTIIIYPYGENGFCEENKDSP
jgi:hypothetical protein